MIYNISLNLLNSFMAHHNYLHLHRVYVYTYEHIVL